MMPFGEKSWLHIEIMNGYFFNKQLGNELSNNDEDEDEDNEYEYTKKEDESEDDSRHEDDEDLEDDLEHAITYMRLICLVL